MSTESQSPTGESIEGTAALEARIEELKSELAEIQATEDDQQMVIIATKGTSTWHIRR